MRAAGGRKCGEAVLTIANHRRTLTDTIQFHKAFSRIARIQCEANGVLIIGSALTAGAQYATIAVANKFGKPGETGNDVRGGLFENWIARAGD